jgi:hypothetical protein
MSPAGGEVKIMVATRGPDNHFIPIEARKMGGGTSETGPDSRPAPTPGFLADLKMGRQDGAGCVIPSDSERREGESRDLSGWYSRAAGNDVPA